MHTNSTRFSRRSIHLLDLENLASTPHLTASIVASTLGDYAAAVQIGPQDHVVLAISHHNLLASHECVAVRRLVRSGRDGAESALIEALETERMAERFGRIVIGSGDGLFAAPVARLAAAGVAVEVASRPYSLSMRLRLASPRIHFVDHVRPFEEAA